MLTILFNNFNYERYLNQSFVSFSIDFASHTGASLNSLIDSKSFFTPVSNEILGFHFVFFKILEISAKVQSGSPGLLEY